jgi:hypothetical protein
MAQDTDVLLKMYEEAMKMAIHQQNQRSSLTTLIFTISAAILGFITLDRSLNFADLPLTLFLTILGFFGAAFCIKQHERYARYSYQATECRKEIQRLIPTAALDVVFAAAEQQLQEKHPLLHSVPIWGLWVTLHLAIAFAGVVLSIVSIIGAKW